jgi:hypothetical protein
MAGQSATEFAGYSGFLPSTTRPAAFTSYFGIAELLGDDGKAAQYFTETREGLDALGDADHVVLPHVSMSLTTKVGGRTTGAVVLADINAGKYDKALREFAAAVPEVGRPLFLRIGYEFNGHWNNYSAPEYVQAWRRIEAALAVNKTTRAQIALVWDMSCDAVALADTCTTAASCWEQSSTGQGMTSSIGLA